MFRIALLLIVLVASAQAEDGPIVGQATVIDGDTIEIHGTRIRLSGIDAPESDQVCAIGGRDEPCGRRSAFFLADLIGRDTVYCTEDGKDRYGRTLAHCEAGGRDIGSAMVRAGQALAFRRYSGEYLPVEAEAKRDRVGMWASDFLPPWEWRALSRR